MQIRSCGFWAGLSLVMLSVAGCNSGPKIVPVSGIVLIDGQPLTQGTVQVIPSDYRAASGKLGPDGRFTLTTFKDNDGCVVGTHPVCIVATETLTPTSHKWHAPKKYVDAATNGLTIKVDGATKDIKIELTWAGGKPFVENFNKE